MTVWFGVGCYPRLGCKAARSRRPTREDLVNSLQFVGRELQVREGRDVLLDLRGPACSNQRTGHAVVPQDPGKRHLGNRLPAFASQLLECSHLVEPAFLNVALFQESMGFGSPRVD